MSDDMKKLKDEDLVKVYGGENKEMSHDDYSRKRCQDYLQSSTYCDSGLVAVMACQNCQYSLESGGRDYCTLGKTPTKAIYDE